MNHYSVPSTGELFTSLGQDHETQQPFSGGFSIDQCNEMIIQCFGAPSDDEDVYHETGEANNEAAHLNDRMNEDVTNDNSSRPSKRAKKGRGKSKPKFGVNGPEKIDFNNLGQAYGDRKVIGRFATLIGTIARDPANFPINVGSWEDFSELDKDMAWKQVKV